MEVQKDSLQRNSIAGTRNKCLKSSKPLEEIDIKLISTLKPLDAAWVVDFYNCIMADEGKDIVINSWKSTEIYNALQYSSKQLLNMDPFHDIDPLMGDNTTIVKTNLDAVCQQDQEQLDSFRNLRDNDKDHEDMEETWELENYHTIAFDVSDNVDDEPSL